MNTSVIKRLLIIAPILFLFGCFHKDTADIDEEDTYRKHVGDIIYDSTLDGSARNFKPCSKNYSYQYYNFESNGLKYKGEKPQLIKELLSRYKAPDTFPESGYITIRFLVNCKGESGYFRVKQIDENYIAKEFPEELVSQLKTAVESLKGWEIKTSQYGARDYHQYLTFKIENNEIKSIIP